MGKPEPLYEISLEADKDLEDIFDYTVDKFGIAQAIVYVSSFELVFENLAVNPELGRKKGRNQNSIEEHGKR